MPVSTWTDFAPRAKALREGKKWHVFLSYRSVNRPWVLHLYDILRNHGYEVFLDQVVLSGGEQLISSLKRNLRASEAGVLIWSHAAADSAWVEKEYETMEHLAEASDDFHFVPIRLDDSALPGFADLKIFFDFNAYPDGPNGGELLRLLHAISNLALSPEAANFASAQDVAMQDATAELHAAINNGAHQILTDAYRAGGLLWETTSVLGCKVVEGLTKLKEYDEAVEVGDQLQSDFPMAIRPKQLLALALARRGAENDLQRAQQILGALEASGHEDPETLGIYARTWMDRYALSGNILELRRARDLYVRAFKGSKDDYYTGINAVAKSVLIGESTDLKLARELAESVEAIVGAAGKENDYWFSATVAGVQLIKENYEEAGRLYQFAVDQAPTETGSHESTWLQACRLMQKLNPDDDARAEVRKAFAHLPDCEAMLNS